MITVYARGFFGLTYHRLSAWCRKNCNLVHRDEKVKLLALFRAMVMEDLRRRHGEVAWRKSMRRDYDPPMSPANCQRILGGRFMDDWRPRLETLAVETAAMFEETGAGTRAAASFVPHLSLQEFEAALTAAFANPAHRHLLPKGDFLPRIFGDYVRARLYWLLQKEGLALDFSPPTGLAAAERRLLDFGLLERNERAAQVVEKALLLVIASLQWQSQDKARCTRGQVITAVERALGSRPGLRTPEAWQALQEYVIAALAAKIMTQRTFRVMGSPVEITLDWGRATQPDLETAAEAWRRADWDGWRRRGEHLTEVICRQLTKAPSMSIRLPHAMNAGLIGTGRRLSKCQVPLATSLLRSVKSRK